MMKAKQNKFCLVPYCEKEAKKGRKGYCEKHYMQIYRHGYIKERKVIVGCKVEGCESPHCAKGYCNRHLIQYNKFGKIKGNPKRSMFNPNDFVVDGNIVRIKLYDKLGNYKGETLVDFWNYGKVKTRKWYLTNHNRVASGSEENFVFLSNFIMDHVSTKNSMIDHKDRNTLNNREANFRFCTKTQNAMNSKLRKDNTSGYKGVSYYKPNGKWRAYINIEGIRKSLGIFTTAFEAAKAYNNAALKYFGEFANLNKIMERSN